jgi:hypothetical protein
MTKSPQIMISKYNLNTDWYTNMILWIQKSLVSGVLHATTVTAIFVAD